MLIIQSVTITTKRNVKKYSKTEKKHLETDLFIRIFVSVVFDKRKKGIYMRCIKIGIDPDVHKSGIAVVIDGELVTYQAVGFFDVIRLIRNNNTDTDHALTVVIEAGWLNKKSSWHASNNISTSLRIAKNVGANHQIGKLFEEYCQRAKIKYLLAIPKTRKLDTPKDKARIAEIVGKKISNQDIIDAIALVYDHVTALKYV